jgi:signal transduction histidine kinase/ligand-binding sensor domain-containing protein
MNKILLAFALLVLQTSILTAQFENIQSSQITTRDGLNDNRINCIIKDSRGFMWFGTQTGLCRYDGYNFTVYSNDEYETKSMSSNIICDIQEDQEGNLWILTKDALEKFDRMDETFTRFKSFDPTNWLLTMNLGSSGKIWVGSWSKKLWQFDIATQRFSPVELVTGEPDSLFKGEITSILEDKNNTLWIGTLGGGIYSYDLADNQKLVAHYQHDPQDNNSLSNDTIWPLYEDRSGTIWCGTLNGLNQISHFQKGRKDIKFVRYYHEPGNAYSISSNKVVGIGEDDSGLLWLRAINGINTYNRKTGQFSNWQHDEVPLYSFETFLSLNTLHIDDSGIIWFGLYSQGITKLKVNNNRFRTIQHDPENTNSLSNNGVSSFFMDTTGVLWIGTWEDGLNKRVPGKNRNDSPTWIHYTYDPGNPLSLNNNNIKTVFRDRSGVFWIGTGGGGLNKLVETKNKGSEFLHYKPDSLDGDFNNYVDIIYEDEADTLWIGASSGLYIFNREEEQFYRYVFDTLHPDSIEIRAVNVIAEEPSGIIWVSTWNDGLFKIAPPFKRIGPNAITGVNNVSYTYGDNIPRKLSDWQVRTLCVPKIHKKIQIWIGTSGGGLFGLKQMKGPNGMIEEKLVNYNKSDGLPDNDVEGIEEDNEGNLWVSTGNGLSLFNPVTETFINYHKEDGLPSNVFGWLAHYRSPDNELYYGIDGILSFYPDSIPQNNIIPPVVITGIKLFNQAIPIGSESPLKVSPIEAREITLSNNQNYPTFEFAALNYFKTEQNRYKYRLEGQDIDWVDAGTKRTASYQNLQPGQYTFRVIASNNDGVWNEEGTSLKITIKPPWWKTIVAYFSYLLAIGIFIFFYNRYRVNKMDKEKRVLEDKVRERTIQLEEHKEELEAQKEELHQQKEELQQTLDYLKEMQNQLVQSEKLASIGQLTAGIAHEINNPVNYISAGIDSLSVNLKEIKQVLDMYDDITPSNVEMKLKAINDTKTKLDYYEALKEIDSLITSIKSGSDRTAEIVKGLRTFSRLDEGELKEADIHEGIDMTLVMLHNKYKHHIEVIKEYGSIPLINCYPGKLNQVFMNIISNAIDAIEEKGTITVKTYTNRVNGTICISIRDTGKGMNEQEKAKIFDPFFTTKKIGKGTGLGLSVSHGIIEQHRGTIEVISKPGEGTEFIVSLPDGKK